MALWSTERQPLHFRTWLLLLVHLDAFCKLFHSRPSRQHDCCSPLFIWRLLGNTDSLEMPRCMKKGGAIIITPEGLDCYVMSPLPPPWLPANLVKLIFVWMLICAIGDRWDYCSFNASSLTKWEAGGCWGSIRALQNLGQVSTWQQSAGPQPSGCQEAGPGLATLSLHPEPGSANKRKQFRKDLNVCSAGPPVLVYLPGLETPLRSF